VADAFFKNSKTQPEIEESAQEQPKPAEPAPEPQAAPIEELTLAAVGEEEDGWIEDDNNPANNVRRKLWRMQSALDWIEDDAGWIEEVGAALWRMSNGNRAAGCDVFVGWAGEKVRGKWHLGFDGAWGSVERIYREAQRAGWRYPIAHNLNKLDEMVVRVEAALVRAGAEIYQLGNRLVRPVKIEVWAAKGQKTRIAVLVPIDQAFLKSELTRLIDFFKWKKEEREGSGPRSDVVSAVLSRYGKWKFPVVTGVITSPTLRRDGSLLASEGWDVESGLLVVGPLPQMWPIGTTRADAEKAVGLLDDLLDEFPWVDGPSRSVALSGLITPVVRPALDCAPLHGSSAPAAGTGKSFVWDVSAAIAIGDIMPIIAAGMNAEEMEKRIDAQVIEGVGLWSIDNVSIPLGGDGLCQAIERPMYKPRILGKSEMRERRNIWSIFAAGNNLRFKDDVTRRVLRAGMDAKMERPELRRFAGNPLERALAERGRYLWAALTVVRAYQVAGRLDRLPWIGDIPATYIRI
jgi:putative DNA primase/helicase